MDWLIAIDFAEVIQKKKYANISPAWSDSNFITLSYYQSNINEFPRIRISLLPNNEKKNRQISKARDDTRQTIIDIRFQSVRLRVK